MEDRILTEIDKVEMFRRGFAMMTTWERFVICLNLHGVTCTRIAEISGVSKSAVSSTRRNALKKFNAIQTAG